MPIPTQVIYRSTGKKMKQTRHVIGFVFPTVICQLYDYTKRPLMFDMGDCNVNWNETSAGYEFYSNRNILTYFNQANT